MFTLPFSSDSRLRCQGKNRSTGGSRSRPTGTDARAIQVARDGVPTGLVGIPLRYMHTPSEVIDLNDLEAVVQLLVSFARSLKKGEKF